MMKSLKYSKETKKIKQNNLVKTISNNIYNIDYIDYDAERVFFKEDKNSLPLDIIFPIKITKENENIVFKAIGIDIECSFHFTQKKCVFWNKGKLYFKNGIQIRKIKYIHDLQNIFDKYDEKFDVNLDAEINDTEKLF